LRPGAAERDVALPVEPLVDHDAVRDRGGRVAGVRLVLLAREVREGARAVVRDRPVDRLRVRVDQELCGIEPVSRARIPGAVHPVAVALARADAGQVGVPDVRRLLCDGDALLAALVVEQAELHALGVLAVEGEVRPVPVPGRAEGERPPGPDRALHRRTLASWSAG